MKYICMLLLSVMALGCHHKEMTDEERKEKAERDAMAKARQIAAPMIADQLGDMNLLLAKINDATIPCRYRFSAVEELRNKFPEYFAEAATSSFLGIHSGENMELEEEEKRQRLEHAGDPTFCLPEGMRFLDSIKYSKKFAGAEYMQKQLIEKKCLAEAAQIVYKQALQKKYEAEQKLNQ